MVGRTLPGFLTVLLNTARLGIPTLELIEPVQVWVGIPLAIIFWLVINIYKYFRKHAADLRKDLVVLREQHATLQQLAEQGDVSKAAARLTEFVLKDAAALVVPFVRVAWISTLESSALSVLAEKTAEYLFPGGPGKQRSQERLRNYLSRATRMLSLVQRAAAVSRFFSNILTVLLVMALATYLYIFVAYPNVPQRWGGGGESPRCRTST